MEPIWWNFLTARSCFNKKKLSQKIRSKMKRKTKKRKCQRRMKEGGINRKLLGIVLFPKEIIKKITFVEEFLWLGMIPTIQNLQSFSTSYTFKDPQTVSKIFSPTSPKVANPWKQTNPKILLQFPAKASMSATRLKIHKSTCPTMKKVDGINIMGKVRNGPRYRSIIWTNNKDPTGTLMTTGNPRKISLPCSILHYRAYLCSKSDLQPPPKSRTSHLPWPIL